MWCVCLLATRVHRLVSLVLSAFYMELQSFNSPFKGGIDNYVIRKIQIIFWICQRPILYAVSCFFLNSKFTRRFEHFSISAPACCCCICPTTIAGKLLWWLIVRNVCLLFFSHYSALYSSLLLWRSPYIWNFCSYRGRDSVTLCSFFSEVTFNSYLQKRCFTRLWSFSWTFLKSSPLLSSVNSRHKN